MEETETEATERTGTEITERTGTEVTEGTGTEVTEGTGTEVTEGTEFTGETEERRRAEKARGLVRPGPQRGPAGGRSGANANLRASGLCLHRFFRQPDGWLRQPPAALGCGICDSYAVRWLQHLQRNRPHRSNLA